MKITVTPHTEEVNQELPEEGITLEFTNLTSELNRGSVMTINGVEYILESWSKKGDITTIILGSSELKTDIEYIRKDIADKEKEELIKTLKDFSLRPTSLILLSKVHAILAYHSKIDKH